MKTEIYIDTVSHKVLKKNIYYHINGNIKCEEYRMYRYHRSDGPAVIWYNMDGNETDNFYYLEGKLQNHIQINNYLIVENSIMENLIEENKFIKGKACKIFIIEQNEEI